MVILVLLAVPVLPWVHAHTVDSIDEYRLEIGWMNEPVISRETNGLELFIGQLEPCPEMDSITCATSQEFTDGVGDLEDDLKVQLVYKDDMINLPLVADHNTPGKYHTFVNPTVSGFYQVNLVGNIGDTQISLSMHPPEVRERANIEFPEPEDRTVEQIIDGHTALIGEVASIRDEVARADQSAQIGVIGVLLGAAGLIVAIVVLTLVRSLRTSKTAQV